VAIRPHNCTRGRTRDLDGPASGRTRVGCFGPSTTQCRELLNATIDRFVAEALTSNVPLTLVIHPDGQHAFDTRG